MDEYVLRCELYDVQELIVEGDDDRRVFSEALTRVDLRDVVVLDGDYFQIDDASVDELGVARGVKGRLLALAAAICARSGQVALAARVIVVVDRDYDDVPERARCVALVTDGYSVENYAYGSRTMERFISNVLGQSRRPLGARGQSPHEGRECSGEELLARVSEAAVSVAAVRRTLRHAAGDVGVFDRWLGRVKVGQDGHASLDADLLLRDIVTTLAVTVDADAARKALALERDRVAEDSVRYVRGHDFVAILHKVLKSPWGRRMFGSSVARVDDRSFRRLLLFAIDPHELDASPLLGAMRRRFA